MKRSALKEINNETRVVTCGSFDGLPHPGHIAMLETCRSLGGELLVALAHDDAIRRNKKREPIYGLEVRRQNVLRTGLVTDVVPMTGDADEDLKLILGLKPDIYCLGEDQLDGLALDIERCLGQTACNVRRIPRHMPEVYSTTALYFQDSARSPDNFGASYFRDSKWIYDDLED